MTKIAVCPGSFDPIHNGHVDIIERCCPIFDEVVVAVLRNTSKEALFSIDERVEILREVLADVHHDRYAHVDEAKFVAAAQRIENFVREGRYGLSRGQCAILLAAIQYELSATYYRKRRFGPALRALAASFLYCPWKRPAHMLAVLKTVGSDLKRVAARDR